MHKSKENNNTKDIKEKSACAVAIGNLTTGDFIHARCKKGADAKSVRSFSFSTTTTTLRYYTMRG